MGEFVDAEEEGLRLDVGGLIRDTRCGIRDGLYKFLALIPHPESRIPYPFKITVKFGTEFACTGRLTTFTLNISTCVGFLPY